MIMNVPIPWTTVWANTTTASFHPATYWIGTTGITSVRAMVEMRNRTSDIEVSCGYQTADVENAPDNAVAFGSYITTNTVGYPTATTDIESVCAGKQLIRFGFFAKNTTVTATHLARVSGQVTLGKE